MWKSSAASGKGSLCDGLLVSLGFGLSQNDTRAQDDLSARALPTPTLVKQTHTTTCAPLRQHCSCCCSPRRRRAARPARRWPSRPRSVRCAPEDECPLRSSPPQPRSGVLLPRPSALGDSRNACAPVTSHSLASNSPHPPHNDTDRHLLWHRGRAVHPHLHGRPLRQSTGDDAGPVLPSRPGGQAGVPRGERERGRSGRNARAARPRKRKPSDTPFKKRSPPAHHPSLRRSRKAPTARTTRPS